MSYATFAQREAFKAAVAANVEDGITDIDRDFYVELYDLCSKYGRCLSGLAGVAVIADFDQDTLLELADVPYTLPE